MRNFFNLLLVLFASLVGYIVVSRVIEDSRDFR